MTARDRIRAERCKRGCGQNLPIDLNFKKECVHWTGAEDIPCIAPSDADIIEELSQERDHFKQSYGRKLDEHAATLRQASNLSQELDRLGAQQESVRPLIDRIMVGGNHLASALIGCGFMPDEQIDYDSVLSAFGQPAADMWVAWRAIMDLSASLRQESGE